MLSLHLYEKDEVPSFTYEQKIQTRLLYINKKLPVSPNILLQVSTLHILYTRNYQIKLKNKTQTRYSQPQGGCCCIFKLRLTYLNRTRSNTGIHSALQ